MKKKLERERDLIRTFNLAQAGGDAANQRLRQIDFELQKIEYDELGIEPGKEQEHLYGKDE